jgi:hypothetical protein
VALGLILPGAIHIMKHALAGGKPRLNDKLGLAAESRDGWKRPMDRKPTDKCFAEKRQVEAEEAAVEQRSSSPKPSHCLEPTMGYNLSTLVGEQNWY